MMVDRFQMEYPQCIHHIHRCCPALILSEIQLFYFDTHSCSRNFLEIVLHVEANPSIPVNIRLATVTL